eukprot:m.149368 g.149368  ORF g.149368 m.149368 type:complete len:256 (+) comp24427_c0_seq4:198-965(+)
MVVQVTHSCHPYFVDAKFLLISRPPHLVDPLKSINQVIEVCVWTGISGVYHDHITNSELLIKQLNEVPNIHATISHEKEFFANRLSSCDVLLMYSDTYENPGRGSLTPPQLNGLLQFVEQGKALFGLHTACACFLDIPEFVDLLGVSFAGHSLYFDFAVRVLDNTHPITFDMHDFVATDELYHPSINVTRSTVLLESFDPTLNSSHPALLWHNHGKGKVLYFALGHDLAEFLGNKHFFDIVKRSILWLGGNLKEF